MKYLDEFAKLNLPSNQYAIFGSGPLAIRGLRENDDLDVIVTQECWVKLIKKYSPAFHTPNKDIFRLGNIEITNYWFGMDIPKLIKESDEIDGFKYVNLTSVMEWKEASQRESDREDIILIESYLKKNES